MLTQKIDAGLDALDACRRKVPAFAAIYRPGSPVREALEAVVEAVNRAEAVMTRLDPKPPGAG